MPDLTPDDELRKTEDLGRKAQALLDNPVLVGVFEDVQSSCARTALTHPDADTREEHRHTYKAIERVRDAITSVVRAGETARAKLDHLAER